jgi:hypothetical protein
MRELERKMKKGFKDKFPCLPEFFSWESDAVDLAEVDAHALAREINRHLVQKSKRNEFVRSDVPFTLESEVAGGPVQVKVLSQPIREMQQEIERLAMERRPPFPEISNN